MHPAESYNCQERLSFYFCGAKGEVNEYPGSRPLSGCPKSGSSALRSFQINDPGF